MRAIVTGQVGVDKGPYLEAVQKAAHDNGHDLVVCHVGKMMYEEAPDVPKRRILNLPISRLNTLRRAVFKEVLQIAEKNEHVIINTHATFRWRHGLFAAFDYDQMKQFDADIYISLMDNADFIATARSLGRFLCSMGMCRFPRHTYALQNELHSLEKHVEDELATMVRAFVAAHADDEAPVAAGPGSAAEMVRGYGTASRAGTAVRYCYRSRSHFHP